MVEGPKGEPIRLLSRRLSLRGWNFVILAGDDITIQKALVNSFRTVLWYSVPIVIILTVAGALIIVIPLLRSVKRLSHKVEEITEKNLEGVVTFEEMDSELVELANVFNSAFRRLDEVFLLQRKFLSDAVYEIRAPLSIIKSDCDITLKKERGTEKYRETIAVVYETFAGLPVLIEKVLDVARLKRTGMVLKKELLDLSQVVGSVYKLISPIAKEKGISLNLHGAEGGGLKIKGDKERLSELFMHLIENGVKYNRRGGTVEITCTAPNKNTAFEKCIIMEITWLD